MSLLKCVLSILPLSFCRVQPVLRRRAERQGAGVPHVNQGPLLPRRCVGRDPAPGALRSRGPRTWKRTSPRCPPTSPSLPSLVGRSFVRYSYPGRFLSPSLDLTARVDRPKHCPAVNHPSTRERVWPRCATVGGKIENFAKMRPLEHKIFGPSHNGRAQAVADENRISSSLPLVQLLWRWQRPPAREHGEQNRALRPSFSGFLLLVCSTADLDQARGQRLATSINVDPRRRRR